MRLLVRRLSYIHARSMRNLADRDPQLIRCAVRAGQLDHETPRTPILQAVKQQPVMEMPETQAAERQSRPCRAFHKYEAPIVRSREPLNLAPRHPYRPIPAGYAAMTDACVRPPINHRFPARGGIYKKRQRHRPHCPVSAVSRGLKPASPCQQAEPETRPKMASASAPARPLRITIARFVLTGTIVRQHDAPLLADA